MVRLLLIVAAIPACSKASPPVASSSASAPVSVLRPAVATNENTFDSLKPSLARISEGQLVRSEDGDVLGRLAPDQIELVRQTIERCEPIDSLAFTPPPWPVVIRVATVDGDEWFLQLTAAVIRMDRAEPRSPSLASMQSDRRTVQDCALHEGDDTAIWALHELHLGPTREKSYATPFGP